MPNTLRFVSGRRALKESVAWFLWQSQFGASQSTHRFLLPPLPAQLSVGRRHGLNHEGGGHVAAGGRGGRSNAFTNQH